MIDCADWTPNHIHEMRLILRECETLEMRKDVIKVLINEGGGSSTLYDFMTRLKEYQETCMKEINDEDVEIETFDKYTAMHSLYYDFMQVVGPPHCWEVSRNLDNDFRKAIDYDSDTSTIGVMSEVESVEAESDSE